MNLRILPAVLGLGMLLAACSEAPRNENGDKGGGADKPGAATETAAKTEPAAKETAGSGDPDISIPYEKFTLDNGLTVVVHEDRKAPIVAVAVWYHVGSRNEPEGKTGFAHLFEHLMFNGSENHDDEYFRPLENVGATGYNGTTNFDRTNYFQNVPTPALDLVLWLESDRMGHLLGAVTQEKLDNQRGVVQNEKRQGDNQPYGRVFYPILEGLFPPGHPYRHSPIGSMEDLNAATLEDVHQWFKDYYGAANAVVVLAGDIDAETARPLMEKYFGDIESGPPVQRLDDMIPVKETDTFEVMEDRVPHTRIYRLWPVPGRTAQDTALLRLTQAVLAEGKNSRLHKSLVYDRQLATEVDSFLFELELSSVLGFQITLKPDADREEVEDVLNAEIERFLEEGPTGDELERASTRLTAQTIRGLEQVGGFSGKAVTLAAGEVYAEDPGFITKKMRWLNEAAPQEVLETSRRWLSNGFYQLTVNPFPDYKTAETDLNRSEMPGVSGLPDLSFPDIQRDQLSNGMEIVLAERHAVPVVNMSVQFDAGYAADHGGKLGAANFTMEMLDEGTQTRSALEISAELERLGARLNTDSTLDTSTVTMSALKAKLAPSVELMADVVRNPAFAGDEIERYRPQLLARISQEKSQPVSIAIRTLPPLLYGEDHAYGIPFTGSGTEDSAKSMSRGDLTAFHSKWLRPDNATIFVAGDTTMAEIKPLLEEAFGDWQASGGEAPSKNVEEVDLPETGRVILIDRPGSPQSVIMSGHLAPPTGAENNLSIETMNDVLGGTFTARLNMNLREDKGWAYGARTILFDARGQRPFVVYAPVQSDKTIDSIREIQRELNAYQGERPATGAEVTRVRNNNVRSLPGRFETANAVLNSLESNKRFGRPDDYVPSLPEKYAQVTPETVEAAAGEVLHPDRMVWIVVGDAAKVEAGLRELDLGPVDVRRPVSGAADAAQ
ncbi:MAG: M16 family metallopeptidase [Alphaproteobacteria bacterium]